MRRRSGDTAGRRARTRTRSDRGRTPRRGHQDRRRRPARWDGDFQGPVAAASPPGASGSSERRTVRTARPIWERRKIGMAMIAAITAWTMRLPEPGSMYAGNGVMGVLLGNVSAFEAPEDSVGAVSKPSTTAEDLVGHVLEVVQVVVVGPR